MALPQQGTETQWPDLQLRCYCSVNGLTPTGDGNHISSFYYHYYSICVNGLTPTGDGNHILFQICAKFLLVLMALPQQGTETRLNHD